MEKHIVIIEDDVELLNLMGLILEREGYKTTRLKEFFNFDELIGLNADCFIIDERLPYVNGHIICIMLKSNAKTKHIPAILTSGYDNLENFAGLCQANAFLTKPFDSAKLLRTVGTIVQAAISA